VKKEIEEHPKRWKDLSVYVVQQNNYEIAILLKVM
jgi:hypothetical protein